MPMFTSTKRMMAVAAAVIAPAIALAGCGSQSNSTSQDASGPVKVTFWHESSGPAADAMTQLINEFNTEHSGKITVSASYQGSYADVQQKYTAAVQSKSTPSILAMNDISTGFMLDSKQTTPVSQFVSADSSFDQQTIPASVRTYYSDSKGLLSMPFSVSQPMLYLNTSIVQQAGLDTDNPPTTIDEVMSWATTIKQKTGKYGFTMNMGDSWILEELTANGGLDLCTPDNGRSSEPVSAVKLTNPEQIKAFGELAELFSSKVAMNPGTDSSNLTKAFSENNVGMAVTSSAAYTTMQPGDSTNNLMLVPLPKISDSAKAGTPIGGNSLWISGVNHSEAEQQASYELAKFLQSAHAQAVWTKATGYLFTNNGANNETEGKEALKDGNVQTMYRQMESNPTSQEALGCRTGAYPSIRKAVIGSFNDAINGTDITTAMRNAETKSAQAIQQYNEAAGK